MSHKCQICGYRFETAHALDAHVPCPEEEMRMGKFFIEYNRRAGWKGNEWRRVPEAAGPFPSQETAERELADADLVFEYGSHYRIVRASGVVVGEYTVNLVTKVTRLDECTGRLGEDHE